ncbi:MAG: hypothetical protein U9N59_01155 [Campylobacterota bacterium]|nr:hypothetical protein [Campylobacterota bacterium]
MDFKELEERNRYLFQKLIFDLKISIDGSSDIDTILNDFISIFISNEKNRFRIMGAKQVEDKKSKRVQIYSFNPKKTKLDTFEITAQASIFVSLFRELKLLTELKKLEQELEKQYKYTSSERLKEDCNRFLKF